MNFYVCRDYKGCVSNRLDGELFSRTFWSGLIYTDRGVEDHCESILQKLSLCTGGIVRQYQTKPLIIKRTL
jgi:hypothetical protein